MVVNEKLFSHTDNSDSYPGIANANFKCTLEFFLNVLTEFTEQKYLSLKGLTPATSCVRDQDTTTVPARHMSQTGSLH